MNEHDFSFRRTHERKLYKTEVVFSHKGRPYSGTVKNISLGGAFVKTRNVNQLSTGDRIIITIPFTDGGKHIKRQGRIRWMNDDGFALEFL